MEESTGVLELTQRQGAEPESVARVVCDLLPPDVLGMVGEAVLAQLGGVEVAPCQRVQRLDRVVAEADVDEVLLDELSDSGDVGVIGLLVEHRSAVAREAARPAGAVGGRSKEQIGAPTLAGR